MAEAIITVVVEVVEVGVEMMVKLEAQVSIFHAVIRTRTNHSFFDPLDCLPRAYPLSHQPLF